MITKKSIEEYAGFRDRPCKEVFAMRENLIKEELRLLVGPVLTACFDELSRTKIPLDKTQWGSHLRAKPFPLDKTQWASHLLEIWEIDDLIERIDDVMDSTILKIGTQLFYLFSSGVLDIPFDSTDAYSYWRLPKREKESVTEGLILVGLWKEAK